MEPTDVNYRHVELSDHEFKSIVSSNHCESEHGESDQDELDMQEEDLNTVLGPSIGKEQTRFMSPTTPAAEKAAAMDDKNDWGFFDGAGGEDPEEHQHFASFDNLEQRLRENADNQVPPNVALPSPWTSTPKLFEISEKDRKTRDSLKNRSRASTGPTGRLADLNIKRFLSGLSFPTLPDQNPFKDLSFHRLPSLFGSGKDSGEGERITGRSHRSNSLFIQKFSWNNSPRNGSPPKDISLHSSNRDGSARQSNITRLDKSDDPQLQIEARQNTLGEDFVAAAAEEEEKQSHLALRRSASDTSLPLQRALSKVSSLGDDSRWEHVQGQVNSRMKAVVDSFQDSTIKLPSLPTINLSALRPDFTLRRASSESKSQVLEPLTSGVSVNQHVPNSQEYTPDGNDKRRPTHKSSKSMPRYFDDALESLKGDVVVMGGYRGSVLRSAEPPHRQLWVPVKVGLNIRKVNLEVGLQPEDEENMEGQIFSSGMLTHIGPVDISRRLLKRLRSCKNAQEGSLRVHDYGYDWRLSPHLLSRKLIQFLQKLECNISGVPIKERGATIIAHSLGGLITRHAVNQHPELFAGVVYAGVPQHCVNILGPLRKGDEVLLSSKVLTAQVNFSLRTSFVLLPESGKCFIDKETKEEYPVDFFHVGTWREFAFSPCIAPCLPSLVERRSLLGAVSGSLPSLVGKIGSFAPSKEPEPKDATPNNTDSMAKPSNLAHPQDHTVNLQMGQSQAPSQQLSTSSTIPLPIALAYLERTLASTLAFKQELAFQPQHASANTYPPISIIYSTSTPTVYGARVLGRDGIKRADAYDNLVFASGDGVVLARAAMVPKGYKVVEGGRVRTERGHVGLLGDLEAVGKCLVAVRKGRMDGVGLAGKEDEDVRG